jgi:cation transport regulator ChaB
MRYDTIDDLPFHCRLHLPDAALHVYKNAWNRAWEQSQDFDQARDSAWTEVRNRFERDALTGRWVAKRTRARAARARTAPAALKRTAQ